TELLDDHRELEPPDPIPNSAVKRLLADGSVGFPPCESRASSSTQNQNPNPLKRVGVLSFLPRKMLSSGAAGLAAAASTERARGRLSRRPPAGFLGRPSPIQPPRCRGSDQRPVRILLGTRGGRKNAPSVDQPSIRPQCYLDHPGKPSYGVEASLALVPRLVPHNSSAGHSWRVAR